MSTIKQQDVIDSVADALQYISYYHPMDYIEALGRAYELEQSAAAKDAIAQILAWKDIEKIWPLATFVAVTRPGHNLELPQADQAAIEVLEVPALAISSTAVRDRVTEGKPIWYLVPDGVVQYIAKHELYGAGN